MFVTINNTKKICMEYFTNFWKLKKKFLKCHLLSWTCVYIFDMDTFNHTREKITLSFPLEWTLLLNYYNNNFRKKMKHLTTILKHFWKWTFNATKCLIFYYTNLILRKSAKVFITYFRDFWYLFILVLA